MKFNIPVAFGNNFNGFKTCGDGKYTKKCNNWFERQFDIKKVLLTTSCTHALEMAAILINIQPGDEVIMPSYTFVSTANAFVLRGAKIIFVDIRPDTMNIDETKVEAAITKNTKAIVPVHYAGVACEMDVIMELANRYNIFVIEDAAQGVMSSYKGRALGSIGDIGCFSFHETKNYSMGEGGAILINNEQFVSRAEIIREKGTDRSRFLRGDVDKYSWVDLGSSYLPSDILACYLWSQLESAESINNMRILLWNEYYKNLKPLADKNYIDLPFTPLDCEHNAHMFFIKCKDLKERSALIDFLKEKKIQSVFHYVPLHSSSFGQTISEFKGEDVYTTNESNRLLRLPMYYGLKLDHVVYIANTIAQFYSACV